MSWTVRSCLCIAACMHFRTDALSLVPSPELPVRGHSTFEASDGQLNLQGSLAAISSRRPGQFLVTDHTSKPREDSKDATTGSNSVLLYLISPVQSFVMEHARSGCPSFESFLTRPGRSKSWGWRQARQLSQCQGRAREESERPGNPNRRLAPLSKV